MKHPLEPEFLYGPSNAVDSGLVLELSHIKSQHTLLDSVLLTHIACSSRTKGLKKFLARYKSFGGVSAHWIVVGPSDRDTRPATGGVLPYYQKCHLQPHPAVKTIANTWYISGVCVHPHNLQFR